MTNRKNTKRALFTSVISMLLCVTMLIGSTFAWFTDNASTGVNSIEAGNLDITLMMKQGDSWVDAEDQTVGFKTADNREQTAILWEPGCRYELQELKLVNNGNLHAKYKVIISATTGDVDLANVIDVYETVNGTEINLGTLRSFLDKADGIKEGVIAPNEELAFGTLKLVMQESAGNQYMDKSIENIAITVLATQATVESDSIDNQYDAGAEYDETDVWDGTVSTLSDDLVINDAAEFAAFAAAVNAGDNFAGKIVKLTKNIDLANLTFAPINNFAGTFDGQNRTISNLTANLFGTVSGTVKNLNVKDVNVLNTAYNGANGFIATLEAGGLVDKCTVSDATITWADNVTNATDCWGGAISRINAGAIVQDSEFNNIKVQSNGKMKRTGGVFAEVGGKITGCTINCVTLITTHFTQQTGAVIGDVYYGAEVSDCTFNDVTLDTYRALSSSTGGIIGKAGVAGSGTIADMTLKNITVNGLVMKVGNTVDAKNSGVNNVGGFIGQVDHRTNDARLSIEGCHIYGLDMTVASLKKGEDPSAGFIASLNGGADIKDCSVSGEIDGTNEFIGIGGFLGTVGGYGAGNNYVINITDCSADVAITGNDNIFVGGFVGYAGSYNQTMTYTLALNFTNCEATGSFYGQLETGTNETTTFNGCKVDGADFAG